MEEEVEKKGREPRACTIRDDEPSVLKMCLDYLHKQLLRKDVHGIFAYPVNDLIAPGYSSIIQYPMDFSTMGLKLEDEDYNSVAEYKRDFVLMCNNAMTYNQPETIFYKEAKRLLQSGSRILSKEKLLFYKRSLSFMANITLEELGLDQAGEELTIAVDMAAEKAAERERALAREKKKKPKQNKFEAIPDNLTPEEILEQAQIAAKGATDRLTLRQPDSKFGFLRRRDDGSTTFNILNPDNDGIVSETERIVSLGMLMGKLTSGTGSMAGFKEDKRNKVVPVSYLNYGPFSSFAPTYDSSFANVTKEESDLLLSTYGDDTGVQYARSVLNFVENAGSFAVKMVDEILDNLTKGEHMKTQRTLDQNAKDGTEKAEGQDKSDKKKKKSKGSKSPTAKPETVDINSVRSLAQMGVDVSFLDTFEKEMKEKKIQETQQKLDNTAELIQNLQKTQHERLSMKPPHHLAHVPGPSEKEVKLADKVCQELKELAKEVAPGAISSVKSIRQAMGVSLSPVVGAGGEDGGDAHSQAPTQLSHDDAVTADIDRELQEFLEQGPGLKVCESPSLEKDMDITDSPLAQVPLS
ncbi:bromodomain-containing protein 7-like [Liolophura sinensis]|uniref:bromodomain-containing protein 7-like n=1 Tax=Liolophura sinensis TaxID=3198878 RepID=UPI003158F71F